MDTRKTHLILQKIALNLRSFGWRILPEWELQLKSEGNIPLTKKISSDNNIDANINLSLKDDIFQSNPKLTSPDQPTSSYYPEYTVYAALSANGVATHDIDTNEDVDVTFNEADFNNDEKTKLAAHKINGQVEFLIGKEYKKYTSQNQDAIRQQ